MVKGRHIYVSLCLSGSECFIKGISITGTVSPHSVELTVKMEKQI